MVIPALDEADQIVGAFKSARAPGVEVVVVDGGSHDATRQRAVAAGARVIEGSRGRAAQLAVGVAATRSDAIIILHADTRLPVGFDAAIQRVLGDPETVGGAFRFRFDERSLALRVVEWGAWLRVALFGLPYGDQAIFVRRKTLEEIGGIPQSPVMEDLDLVVAMRRCGRIASLDLPASLTPVAM